MSVQQVTLKVTPDPSLRVTEATMVPHVPLLDAEPFAVLGAPRQPGMASIGVSPDAQTCFGPRGAALMAENGPLWVCDTGHHRLLGWQQLPNDDQTPADWVIGQTGMHNEGRNGKQAVSAHSVNVPTGICRLEHDGKTGMAIADAWNHRVLIWDSLPEAHNVPADRVLGQADFTSGEANRGRTEASENSMHWPYGVSWQNDHLLVADSENRRVLIWEGLPETGQPPDTVLGQRDFTCRDENAGADPSAMSMRWPHGIALWRGRLCVSDAGNNRIMIWNDGIPQRNGAPCDLVLGQATDTLVDHNQSLYWPRANSLNMPYAITAMQDWLLVADTANSRLLGWHIDDITSNTPKPAPARALSGQLNFHEKGDNRWQAPMADSFCWPYGLQACGNTVAVADSGNNRVSLWRLAV